MKARKLLVGLLVASLAAVLSLALAGCAKDITVTVQDNGTTTEVSTQTGKTVSDALDAAKVKVGEKDKVDPALDTKLDDKTTKIVVERYAKVKVVKGSESKDVELYGGTVADALKAAGVELSANDTTDVDASAYVKDGMTVNVFTTKKVKVSVDGGEATEVSTKVATVGDVLAESGGAGSYVDRDIKYRASDDSHKFRLAVLTFLEMESPHDTVARLALVVLHEIHMSDLFLEIPEIE